MNDQYIQPLFDLCQWRGNSKIEKMTCILTMDAIDFSKTEWASPLLLVPKKDGTCRFWAVCRILKAVAICGSYLILHMDESMGSLGDATIFLTLTLILAIQESKSLSRQGKTECTVHQGPLRLTHMLIGIKTQQSPSSAL